jgi:hypothetical protein
LMRPSYSNLKLIAFYTRGSLFTRREIDEI